MFTVFSFIPHSLVASVGCEWESIMLRVGFPPYNERFVPSCDSALTSFESKTTRLVCGCNTY